MIVLGIDTSGYANAIGVVDGQSVLANFAFEARNDALERIITDINATLTGAGLKLKDIDGIGVGLGPGSWTGIRVGITVAKMLAFGSGKPVAGIPTLEALAETARSEAGAVTSIISVGTGDSVYAASYRIKQGSLVREGEYYVGDLPGLVETLGYPELLVGPEAEQYAGAIRKLRDVPAVDLKELTVFPDGAVIARLASVRFSKGESDDALALTPLYLKESTAKAFVNRYAQASGAGK